MTIWAMFRIGHSHILKWPIGATFDNYAETTQTQLPERPGTRTSRLRPAHY
jgi:hypothetical protein